MKTKTLKPGRTEAQVQEQILDAARMFGIELRRQNTGGFIGSGGQYVPCGEAGDSDLTGNLPDGRRLDIECKKEGFRPWKVYGEDAHRFATQLNKLRQLNKQGGVGLWTDCPELLVEKVFPALLRGCWIDIDERGVCYVTDESGEAE